MIKESRPRRCPPSQTNINPDGKDPYRQAADSRDGSMAILVGIAARNSIDKGMPVKIGDLTSLKPGVVRG